MDSGTSAAIPAQPSVLHTAAVALLLAAGLLLPLRIVVLPQYEARVVGEAVAGIEREGAGMARLIELQWPGSFDLSEAPQAKARAFDLRAAEILPPQPRPASWPSGPDRSIAQFAERLSPVFDRIAKSTGTGVQLLDHDGRVLSGADRGLSYAAMVEVGAARTRRPDTQLRGQRRQNWLDRIWSPKSAGLRIEHAEPVILNGRLAGVLLLSRPVPPLFATGSPEPHMIVSAAVMLFLFASLTFDAARATLRRRQSRREGRNAPATA